MPAVEQKSPATAKAATPKVKICDYVLWFPNTGDDVVPRPMLVEEVFQTGMVAGNIFQRGQVIFKATVQHKLSNAIKENPKLAIRDGVYLTIEEYYGQKSSAEKAPFDTK